MSKWKLCMSHLHGNVVCVRQPSKILLYHKVITQRSLVFSTSRTQCVVFFFTKFPFVQGRTFALNVTFLLPNVLKFNKFLFLYIFS